MLYEHFNNQDKKAYDLLKEKKILRNSQLSPLMRVSLGYINDFAIQLNVKIKDKSEVFWKWYLCDKEESSELIKEILKPKEIKKPEPEIKKVEEVKEETKKDLKKEQEIKPREKQKKLELEKKKKEKLELDKKKQDELESKKKELEDIKKKIDQEKQKLEKVQKTRKPKKEVVKVSEQEQLLTIEKRIEVEQDSFFKKIHETFKQKDIEINDYEIVKRNSEIDLMISVPTPIGTLDYYCKAKNKKRCNEGDLSTAIVKANLKKLPALFVTPGSITKKTKEMLDKEFKNLNIMMI